MKIITATNNAHKLTEIRAILGDRFEVMPLHEVGFNHDIPENCDTLEENSLCKAAAVDEYLRGQNFPCPYIIIADDTGLMVDALNGEPGVRSARYARGEGHDSEANMRLLLKNLDGKDCRKAHFTTVITMIEVNSQHISSKRQFIGEVHGTILTEKHGDEGFGYDPIFMPDGYDKSFAELGNDVKNKISHRSKAVEKMADYLQKEYQ